MWLDNLLVKEVRMSKPRLIVSLVVIAAFMAGTGQLAAGWWPLQAAPKAAPTPSPQSNPEPAPVPTQKSQRAPIRVGNAVLASKLIHRVPPVFPERAKEARLQGKVMLQVLVDESGIVQEIKILRGHPMLNDAAVEAVSQWCYSPITLKGEPVPVISNVEVFMAPGRIVTIDAEGNLRDPKSELEGETLLEELRGSDEKTDVWPRSGASFETIESTLRMMQAEGLKNLSLKSAFKFYEGRLYYPWNYHGIEKPEVALQEDVLQELVLASGLMDDIRTEKDGRKLLLYSLYVNEVSEIVGVVRLRGPDVPEVVEELIRTPVITPGRRGLEPVPVVIHVEVSGR
jgi:protein TonB